MTCLTKSTSKGFMQQTVLHIYCKHILQAHNHVEWVMEQEQNLQMNGTLSDTITLLWYWFITAYALDHSALNFRWKKSLPLLRTTAYMTANFAFPSHHKPIIRRRGSVGNMHRGYNEVDEILFLLKLNVYNTQFLPLFPLCVYNTQSLPLFPLCVYNTQSLPLFPLCVYNTQSLPLFPLCLWVYYNSRLCVSFTCSIIYDDFMRQAGIERRSHDCMYSTAVIEQKSGKFILTSIQYCVLHKTHHRYAVSRLEEWFCFVALLNVYKKCRLSMYWMCAHPKIM